MSWLDDMEAADPAYPDPDSDPWADWPFRDNQGDPYDPPSWVEWPEAAHTTGERARADATAPVPGRTGHGRELGDDPASRTFTIGEACQVAEDAVGLFLEYRDVHGRAEDEARIEALGEVAQGLHAWHDVEQLLHPDRPVGPDWRALRTAEARARDAGLRASIPHPDGQGSPEYEPDAEAWGTGRGIEPEGPEAG